MFIKNSYAHARVFLQNPETTGPTKKGLAVIIGAIALGAIAAVLGTLMLLAALHQLPQGLLSLSPLGAFGGSIGVGGTLVGMGSLSFLAGAAVTLALALSYGKQQARSCPPTPRRNSYESEEQPLVMESSDAPPEEEMLRTVRLPIYDSTTNIPRKLPSEILPLFSRLFYDEYGILTGEKENITLLFGYAYSATTKQKEGWAYEIPNDSLQNYIDTNLKEYPRGLTCGELRTRL